MRNHCLKCGHGWDSRVEKPKACPACHRYDWREERIRGVVESSSPRRAPAPRVVAEPPRPAHNPLQIPGVKLGREVFGGAPPRERVIVPDEEGWVEPGSDQPYVVGADLASGPDETVVRPDPVVVPDGYSQARPKKTKAGKGKK